MPRSAEERRRLLEEIDNQPHLPGLTYGQFRALPERQRFRELQKLSQRVTSFMGFWKTCDLSPCRRARTCRGFLTEAQLTGDASYHSSFPPCVGPNGARQQEVLNSWRAAFGLPPRETDGPKYDGRQSVDSEH